MANEWGPGVRRFTEELKMPPHPLLAHPHVRSFRALTKTQWILVPLHRFAHDQRSYPLNFPLRASVILRKTMVRSEST
jgi:hypothetical protein